MLLVFIALVALADRVSTWSAPRASDDQADGRQPAVACRRSVRRALPGLLVQRSALAGAGGWPASGAWTCNGRPSCRLEALRQHGPLLGRVLAARHLAGLPAQGAAGRLGDAGDVGCSAPCWPALAGLLLALPASRCGGDGARGRCARWLLNALRSDPRTGLGRAAADLRRDWAPGRHAGAGRCTPPACWAGCSPRRWRTRRGAGRCAARQQGAGAGQAFLRHAAAGAAAAAQLHPVPLGEQHPRRRRAGRGRRRRPGPAAGLPHGPVPHGQDGQHPAGPMLALVALVDGASLAVR
jgi:hypothetical protein